MGASVSMQELVCYGHKNADASPPPPAATNRDLQALTETVHEFQRMLEGLQTETLHAQSENQRLQQRIEQLERENRGLQSEVNDYECQQRWLHLDVLEMHYRALEVPRYDMEPVPMSRRLPPLRPPSGFQATSIATPTLTPSNSTKSLLQCSSGSRLPGLSASHQMISISALAPATAKPKALLAGSLGERLPEAGSEFGHTREAFRPHLTMADAVNFEVSRQAATGVESYQH
jgi:Sec-independent protein translocase protein TatA